MTARPYLPLQIVLSFNLIEPVILFYSISKLWKIFTLFLSGPFIFANGGSRAKKGNTNMSEKFSGHKILLKTWRRSVFIAKQTPTDIFYLECAGGIKTNATRLSQPQFILPLLDKKNPKQIKCIIQRQIANKLRHFHQTLH